MTNPTLDTFPVAAGRTSFNVTAFVREAGEDLLLFLHGLGCSKSTWRGVWQRREFEDFSIVCLDFHGYGDSDRPGSLSYSMEEHAGVCALILSRFRPRRIHVVGHSMGGAVGLLLPNEILPSLASFANVEGNMTGEDCVWASRRTAGVPYHTFMSDIWPEFVKDYEHEGKRFHSLDQASPEAFYRSAESLVAWSDSGRLLDKYVELECNKLYICGDRNADHATVARLEGMDMATVAVSGHFSMIDNPDGFYSALLGLVERNPS